MPIYAYRCETCGFAKDVLQKMSDEPLTECPSCHAAAFKKQVTAAGFQLKGSGWYQTDFRDSGKSPGKAAGKTDAAAGTGAASTGSSDSSSSSSDGGSSAAPIKAAASCAPGCSCH